MAGTTIFGKVTDSGSGTPLGGVDVDVIVMDYPSRGSRLDLGKTRTSADGSYSLVVTLPPPVPPRVGAGAMVPTVWVEVHDGGAHVSRSAGVGLAGLAGGARVRVDASAIVAIAANRNYFDFRGSSLTERNSKCSMIPSAAMKSLHRPNSMGSEIEEAYLRRMCGFAAMLHKALGGPAI